jgi:parallel beta-helix repeat protein
MISGWKPILGFVLGSGIGIFLIAPVQAAVLYVDKDNACPGSGTSVSPYCSIQNAVNAVNAGDTIRIRDAATPYTEVVETTKNGSSGSPITVEPDAGNHPTLRNSGNGATCATFWLHGSYWIIQNLNFDATGVVPCTHGAILVHTTAGNITGTQILNNTFTGWGGTQSFPSAGAAAVTISGGACGDPGNDPCSWPINTLVQGNTFSNNRLQAISVLHSDGTIIRNNQISGQKCGQDFDAVNNIGIKATYLNKNMLVDGNSIHDFDASINCTIPNQGYATYTGYWCDVGTEPNTTITLQNNAIYNIDQNKSSTANPYGLSQESSGIFVESRCYDHIVKNNLIYGIGNYGIRNRQDSLDTNHRNKYYNNTIYSINYIGLWLESNGGIEFKNNILYGSGLQNLQLYNSPASNHIFDYNLYGSVNVFAYNSFLTFTQWQANCNCDSHSLFTNPLFVNAPSDFHLQSASPARGAGENGVDIGALSYIASQPPAAPSNAQTVLQ